MIPQLCLCWEVWERVRGCGAHSSVPDLLVHLVITDQQLLQLPLILLQLLLMLGQFPLPMSSKLEA